MKILFFGASDDSARLLKHLINSSFYNVTGIVTQPSDNAVVKTNRKLKLPMWTPAKLNPEVAGQIKSQLGQPDLIIVLDYGNLIPVELFNWPRLGAVNIHYSLLPAYRGANPVAWAILDRAKKTGVSFVFLSEKFDRGDILAQKEVKILDDETAASLRQKCLQATLQIFDDTLAVFVKAKLLQIPPERPRPYRLYLPPQKQPARSPTHLARRLTRADGRLDWSKPPDHLERQIRAFHPWPGTWTTLGELADYFQLNTRREIRKKRVKILKAHLDKENKLRINNLQVEGKKPISWQGFLAGYHLSDVNQP